MGVLIFIWAAEWNTGSVLGECSEGDTGPKAPLALTPNGRRRVYRSEEADHSTTNETRPRYPRGQFKLRCKPLPSALQVHRVVGEVLQSRHQWGLPNSLPGPSWQRWPLEQAEGAPAAQAMTQAINC
jgi:hypothetical protein